MSSYTKNSGLSRRGLLVATAAGAVAAVMPLEARAQAE
jgi:hypothetical protein